jgi:MFS family permease
MSLGIKRSVQQNIWKGPFLKVFIVNIMLSFGVFAMNTLSATFADYLGAKAMIVGLVSSLFALTAMIFKLFAAPAIDTLNRKHILMAAVAIIIVSFVGYIFSTTIPLLIISRLLTGVGLAFTTTTCLTIASDALPVERMSSGIGVFSLGSVICQAIAPTIGLKLVENQGYTFTFILLTVEMLAAFAVISTMKIEFTRNKMFYVSIRSVIAQEALLPTIILFLLNLTFSVVNAFLVLYATKQGINSNIGFFFTVYALSMLISRPIVGKLADKHGTVAILMPCALIFAASFLIISFATSLPLLLVAAFVSAFGYGGCFPVLLAACMTSVSPERRGAAISTGYIGLDLANLLGPVSAGLIIQSFGYTSMWRLMIIPILIGAAVSTIFRENFSQPKANPSNTGTLAFQSKK